MSRALACAAAARSSAGATVASASASVSSACAAGVAAASRLRAYHPAALPSSALASASAAYYFARLSSSAAAAAARAPGCGTATAASLPRRCIPSAVRRFSAAAAPDGGGIGAAMHSVHHHPPPPLPPLSAAAPSTPSASSPADDRRFAAHLEDVLAAAMKQQQMQQQQKQHPSPLSPAQSSSLPPQTATMASPAPHSASAAQEVSAARAADASPHASLGESSPETEEAAAVLSEQEQLEEILTQLNMEEEELAALWRDYVRSTGATDDPTAAAADAEHNPHAYVSRLTFARQCLLESSAVASHVAAYKAQAAELIQMGKGPSLGPAQSMLLGWYTPLVASLQAEMDDIQSVAREQAGLASALATAGGGVDSTTLAAAAAARSSASSSSAATTSSPFASSGSGIGLRSRLPRLDAAQQERQLIGQHLLQLSAPELACICMHELFGLCLSEPGGVKFIAACMAVGRAVNLEVKVAAIRSNRQEWKGLRAAMQPAGSATAGATANTDAAHLAAAAAARASGAVSSSNSPSSPPPPSGSFVLTPAAMAEVSRRAKKLKSETWSEATCARVGGFLLGIFLKTAPIPANILAGSNAGATNGGGGENNGAGSAAANSPNAAALPLGSEQRGVDPSSAASLAPNAAGGAGDAAGGGGVLEPLAAPLPRMKVPGTATAAPAPFVPAFQHYYLHTNHAARVRNATMTNSSGHLSSSSSSPPSLGGPMSSSSQHKVGMLRADPRVLAAVVSDGKVLDAVMPKLHPMLIRPRTWTSHDNGGYLSVRHKVVRAHGSMLQQDAVRAAPIPSVYAALNFLSSTPWQVNSDVLTVVNALWESGGGVADLPSRRDKALPPMPSRGDQEGRRLYESVRLYNSSLHSQRCDLEYKLRAARQFAGSQPLFYPYFLDFRGRAYPIPPYLNHTGGDLSRGLLRFHDSIARPLGERGLYWLLVHLATLYGGGIDKQAFSARQAWSEARIGEIRESVEDPLHGSRWWLTAEKPFQFLAAANELVRALRHPGGPATFKSSLPVHTDGSCNGLQHYAALGRDLWGGSCVNLTPSDKPQDVYARVLDTVRSKLATEAATPSSPRARMAAKLLAGGGVTRKIVKQTVMTSVYGVTHIGARDQILARLQERPDLVASFGGAAAQQITDATAGGGGAMLAQQQPQQRAMGEDDLRAAAGYLAQLTLSSLFDAFAGARRIQDWLGDCAVRMASLQQPVSWVTPLGLPVIQPYRQAALHTVHTALQAVTLVDHSDLLPVSALRQKSAFPPNFIHSLDASHMLRTALACQGKGVAFASVHDSFWTHAGAMDELSGALRQEFVQLYEQPILEQVRDAWQARFPEITLPPVPKRGQLDIKEVLKSPYFFN